MDPSAEYFYCYKCGRLSYKEEGERTYLKTGPKVSSCLHYAHSWCEVLPNFAGWVIFETLKPLIPVQLIGGYPVKEV